MSWAEPTDMDTLSELASNSGGRPPYLSRTPTGGRSTKSFKSRGISGGASKSERRLLMEAKAGVGAAIAEDRQERLVAKRRARRCVRFLYYAFKVVGVAACAYTSALNAALVYMRPDFGLHDRLVRSYLVLFGVGGVLAELDTPFAKANFRALQKWWFKAPFYVFMAWLCFEPRRSARTVWFPLELAAFAALQSMAVMSVVLNVCLREVLERSGALGKRRRKKLASSSSSRRRQGGRRTKSARGDGGGGRGGEGAGGAGASSGVMGVSSFRERDRRRPSRPPSSSPTSLETGGFAAVTGDRGDNRNAPEIVPERAMSSSGRLFSPPPSSTYSRGGSGGFGGGGGSSLAGGGGGGGGSAREPSYGAVDNGVGGRGGGGGGGGGGLSGTISGKIKWWLDRGGGDGEGGLSPRAGGRGGGDPGSSPASPVSVSTARSGRTKWWEDSDGDDDGTSSMASFAPSDLMSDAGSSVSGLSGAGSSWREGAAAAAAGGGRYGSNTHTHTHTPFAGRGTAPVRRAASVASSNGRLDGSDRRRRRFGGGSVRGGLEERPPPLTMQAGAGRGGGGGAAGGVDGAFAAGLAGGRGTGDGGHVALTAQALARNSNEALPPTGRSPAFGGGGGGGSAYGGSVAGSINGGLGGGGGSLRGYGTRRSSRRPGWEAGAPSRASSVSGDGFRGSVGGAGAGAGPAWAQGAGDYDLGNTASEAGGDRERGEDGRHPRPGGATRRNADIQDYTPF